MRTWSPREGMVLVSACLAGAPCRWNGEARPCAEALGLLREGRALPLCPEQLGGLPTPRESSEILGDRVLSRSGRDLTEVFRRGAEAALAMALASGCREALLKARSPSCGAGLIHDGSFSGRTTAGDGIFAGLLRAAGIALRTEEDAAEAAGPRPAPVPPEIRTERLLLRGLRASDAPALLAYRSDAEVARFQGFKPATLEDAARFIAEASGTFDVAGRWCQLGILAGGELVGDLGIHFIGPENLQCEVGYTLAPREQGKGYGREAVAGLLDFLFSALGKHRVLASVDPRNARSIHLLEALGFRREALHRESVLGEGGWEDDLVYALLAGEWRGAGVDPPITS